MPTTANADPNAAHDTTSTASRPPNFINMLMHIPTTIGLTGSVLQDSRVHWFPKVLFLGSLATLAVALLFPEAASEILGLGIPGVGWALDAIGIPADAGLDWIALTVAAFNLLKLFPSDIVGEHYDRLFRK